jgi:hypothetical protein
MCQQFDTVVPEGLMGTSDGSQALFSAIAGVKEQSHVSAGSLSTGTLLLSTAAPNFTTAPTAVRTKPMLVQALPLD